MTEPILRATLDYAERVRGQVERGEVNPEFAWVVLIADVLGVAMDPLVPAATRDELLNIACSWASQRRTALLVEGQAQTWPPVPDDIGDLDGGA